jgi:hypothetical protein
MYICSTGSDFLQPGPELCLDSVLFECVKIKYLSVKHVESNMINVIYIILQYFKTFLSNGSLPNNTF